MTLNIELTPQEEARLTFAARQKGIDPAMYARTLLNDHLPFMTSEMNDGIGDFGGLTIAEAFKDLLATVNTGPVDLAAKAKDYLKETGFGETSNRRRFGS